MTPKHVQFLITAAIVLLAGFLRLYNINWDAGFHLHPDERFLTMVGAAMQAPSSLSNFLDQKISTLNPSNIGFPFFVYGTLPLFINWLIGLVTHSTTYETFHLQGRVLSAASDILVIAFIYKILRLLEGRDHIPSSYKLWAIFMYAVLILPIQLSHFFTVDTFTHLFVIASLYAALRYHVKKRFAWLIASGCLFGLALGSKVSAIYILPLILYLLTPLHTYIFKSQIQTLGKSMLRNAGTAIAKCILIFGIFGIFAYLILRFADPYLFQFPNIFDPRPSQEYLSSLHQLSGLGSKESWFPPNVQWIHKIPVIFALKNIVLWGVGIPISALALLGFLFIVLRKRSSLLFPIIIWGIFFFLYQSFQTAQTMRYFLPLYSIFAICGAFGAGMILKRMSSPVIHVSLIILIMLPACFFFSIYTKPHTRVTASEWIADNIPSGSTLLSEHWDDALPLPVQSVASKEYKILQLPVFDPDTDEKWEQMNSLLGKGDYLILSSNRGWGSIPTAPERYPQMTQFYKNLFSGKGEYTVVKEFSSYPSLTYLKIPVSIPDDDAEEAFTVYDHPRVIIFKKQ